MALSRNKMCIRDSNMVRQMALDQEENGAAILDVNMGMNGIDEKEMMINTI